MDKVNYINKQMAIDAISGDLPVWSWSETNLHWWRTSIVTLTQHGNAHMHFAIGEKPTSPPRKMIEIDGVRMPAPIMLVEDLPNIFYVLGINGGIARAHVREYWIQEREMGNVFATEADAIAARDGWLKVKKQAMERAK